MTHTKLRIVIEYGVTVRTRLGKGFAQLLDDPFPRWVGRDIEIQEPASIVLND
jgi:hypothetical protein